MPNNLTDAEVKKALEKQLEEVVRLQDGFLLDGRKTTELETLLTNTLDLITRQEGENEKNENIIRIADKTIATLNAENESLKAEVKQLEREIEDLESIQEISPEVQYLVDAKADKVISLLTEITKSQDQIKSAAYKEFAERLDKEFSGVGTCNYGCVHHKTRKVLKELVGGSDG